VSKYKEIEGQCGTCRFADCFEYGPCPSGPEDGVHCTSEEHAKWLDEQMGGTGNVDQLKQYGYLDLFRLEVLEGEDYECPYWQPKV
jgi:hypothetical protein